MYHSISKCRLCNSQKIEHLITFKSTPLANNLFSIKKNNAKKFPLKLCICRDCKHIQLSIVVSSGKLFNNYNYLTGISSSFVSHFKKFSERLSNQYFKNKKFKIIDIGSNDGLLLKCFDKKNTRIGVEPAKNLKAFYKDTGIYLYNDFFNKKVINDIKKRFNYVDVITANNVFAHIDDLQNIVKNVNEILVNGGLFIIEVSYLLDMVKSNSFDSIYHEHLSYHSLIPLKSFFDNLGFQIIDVQKINTHGGSIRVFLRKSTYKTSSRNLHLFIHKEKLFYKSLDKKLLGFTKNIKNLEKKILNVIKSNNFIGYGCPAKAMTFMFNISLNYKRMKFIVDDNKLKQNKYIPIKNIPIANSDNLVNSDITYILIFSWNVFKDIIKRNRGIFKGKTIIVPLPKFKKIKC